MEQLFLGLLLVAMVQVEQTLVAVGIKVVHQLLEAVKVMAVLAAAQDTEALAAAVQVAVLLRVRHQAIR
jgi:hypothetical protein